jgi:hypothetical protein
MKTFIWREHRGNRQRADQDRDNKQDDDDP